MLNNRGSVTMDTTFAQRLTTACDGHPDVPPYGRGRQTWIKRHTGVSNEAVRKWFKGEARPKPTKMKTLANILGVDEAWLSLGIAPDETPAEKKKRSATVTGAVNVVAGFIQLNGGSIAFPSEDSPASEFTSLYAILEGQQFPFYVSMAKQLDDNTLRFYLPADVEACRAIGVVTVSPVSVHMINMKPHLVEKYKQRRGGYYEVDIYRDGDMYFSEGEQWPRILSFNGKM